MMTAINTILLPAGGLTPISIVAWFGFLGPVLLFTVGFLRSLAKSRGKG